VQGGCGNVDGIKPEGFFFCGHEIGYQKFYAEE
jgi:hypothetical protein